MSSYLKIKLDCIVDVFLRLFLLQRLTVSNIWRTSIASRSGVMQLSLAENALAVAPIWYFVKESMGSFMGVQITPSANTF